MHLEDLSLGRVLDSFLLAQTCEIPATARGNRFRPFAFLDNLHMIICCTGTRLLAQEKTWQKYFLADLIITEIHWHWVVPAYLPLEVFIFGKGSGIGSCLAKRVNHQLPQGETKQF